MIRGTRSVEEDAARSLVRSICLRNGAKIRKIDQTHVQVDPCDVWPQGLTTAFNGWQDVLVRLQRCCEHPHDVVDGYYILNPSVDRADLSALVLGTTPA